MTTALKLSTRGEECPWSMSNIRQWIARLCEIEVDQPDRKPISPHDVPCPEVAVTDDLPWARWTVSERPAAPLGWLEPFRCLVILAEEPSECTQSFLRYDHRPTLLTGVAGDVAQGLAITLDTDRHRHPIEPVGPEVSQQCMNGGRPWVRGSRHAVTFEPDLSMDHRPEAYPGPHTPASRGTPIRGSEVLGGIQVLGDGEINWVIGMLIVAPQERSQCIGTALVTKAFERTGANRLDLVTEGEGPGF